MGHWAKRDRAYRGSALVVPILLLSIGLAACGGRFDNSFMKPPAPEAANNSTVAADAVTPSSATEPTLALSPPSGYGGLYIQVSGEHWPPNMMILVRLEDEQGRSETLAATDTDLAGNLATGFLYPIEERWLDSVPRRVVVTTADGRSEAKADFTVVPPGTEIQLAEAPPDAPLPEAKPTASQTLSHELALPIVHAQSSPGAVAHTQTKATLSDGTAVQIQIAPGRSGGAFDCQNSDEIFRLAILTTDSFNAANVDPGSVTVTGDQGGVPLGAAGSDGYQPVLHDLRPVTVGHDTQSKDELATTRVSQNWGNYRWRWHVEDVDGDGDIDLVMEFRLSFIELACEATAVTISGRTKNGQSFTSVSPVQMAPTSRG